MSKVLEQLIQAADQHRLAHAYLLVAPLRSTAEAVIGPLAAHLFQQPQLASMQQLRQHADVAWVEPASRSRRILVDDLSVVLKRLSMTSYEGGYKVCVIFDADRMNDSAANKFLKTLEEPPGHSLILLVSAQPEEILPTIKSRCQILRLGSGSGVGDEVLKESVVELLASEKIQGTLGALGTSQQLKGLFEGILGQVTADIQEEAGEETSADVVAARVQSQFRAAQAEVLTLMQNWYRDILLVKIGGGAEALYFPEHGEVLQNEASKADLALCYRRIEHLDSMAGQLERNIPLKDVVEAGSLALAGE